MEYNGEKEDYLIPETTYRCTYCGKTFRSKRHRCKFWPGMRNCLSCSHCLGVETVVVQDVDNRSWWEDAFSEDEEKKETHTEKVFICMQAGIEESEQPLSKLAEKHWEMKCPKYECIPNFKGKESYVSQMLRKHISEEERWISGERNVEGVEQALLLQESF